jgi:hypothetical protein
MSRATDTCRHGIMEGACEMCTAAELHKSGNIHYSCGHVVWDKNNPQDMDWQSEVECPSCSALANSEPLVDAGVFDLEREIK